MQSLKEYSFSPISLSDPSASPRWLSLGQPGLNEAVGGGFPSQTLIEVFGKSSAGKTQLAMQLCLLVQLPKHLGGFAQGSQVFLVFIQYLPDAVYLGTEKEFPIDRFNQIASSYLSKLSIDNISTHQANDRIHVNLISSAGMFKETLNKRLPYLLSKKSIGLVVVDSIGALFRGYEDNNQNQMLIEFANQLSKLAHQYNLVVVFINQVAQIIWNQKDSDVNCESTTEIPRNEFDLIPEIELTLHKQVYSVGKIPYRPALGLTWSNLINARFLLARCVTTQETDVEDAEFFNSDKVTNSKLAKRKLSVFTCPWAPPASAYFIITQEGLVDI